jgi:hypothetical protein
MTFPLAFPSRLNYGTMSDFPAEQPGPETLQRQAASNGAFSSGTLYLAVVQSDPPTSGNPHEVNVSPTDTSGHPKDAGFDLIVAC